MQIQKQCELQVKKDFNEAKKDKKKADSIIAEVNATKELNSSLTAENIVLKKDNSLLQIENDYLENIIEIGHQEIDRIERYKAENAGINNKIKNMTLAEENKFLRKVISDVATALKELDAFLDEHTNIQYHSKIREMVRFVSNILNKASRKKPETTRDRGLEH